jgi:STE24 endopeptidase
LTTHVAVAVVGLLAVMAAAASYARRKGRAAILAFREAPLAERALRLRAGARHLRRVPVAGAAGTIAGLAVAIALMRNDATMMAGLIILLSYLALLSLVVALPIIRYRAVVVGASFDAKLVLAVFRTRTVLTALNLSGVAVLVWLCAVVGGHLQPPWMIVAFAIVASLATVLLLMMIQPRLIGWLGRARPLQRPAADAALDRLRQQAALSAIDIFVLPSPLRAANAWLTGLSVRRPRIFVTDTLVAGLSDDELVAVVAHEVAHAKARHVRQLLYRKIVSVLLSISIFITVVYLWTRLRPHSHPLTAYLVASTTSALVVHFLPGRSQQVKELDADAVAGGWVGTETLGRALQKLFELNQDSDDGRAARRLSSHPALRDRLARLGEPPVQISGAGPGRDR